MLHLHRPMAFSHERSEQPEVRDVKVRMPDPPAQMNYFSAGGGERPLSRTGEEWIGTGTYGTVVDPNNINALGIASSEGANDVLEDLATGRLGFLDLVEQQIVRSETRVAPVRACQRDDYGMESQDLAAFEVLDATDNPVPYDF